MVFSSNVFLFAFLPAFFVVYLATPRQYKNVVLLVANLLFYALGTGTYVLLLIVSIVANQIFVTFIVKANDPAKSWWLWFAVIFNLSFLAYYKYTQFLLENLISAAQLFGIEIPMVPPALPLPLGISFFTFQAISYVVDVYLDQIRPARSLVEFGAYHSLFPQLLAGPIVRYSEVATQMVDRTITWEGAAAGAYRLTLGLGKKLLIANPIGSVSDMIFATPAGELSMGMAWLGAFSYALQVYFDFSGYSDMAIGLGRILGFTFPENFNQPFRAQSITEFWRRWHITLFRWFRDYLFIPLGGSRFGIKSYLALMWVFILCGLWHAPEWTYIVWGAYQGVLLSIERYFAINFRFVQRGFFAVLLTFILTLIGFVVIRCDSMDMAWQYLAVMFGLHRPTTDVHHLLAVLQPDKLVAYAFGIFFAWLPVERFATDGVPNRGILAVKYTAGFVILLLSVIALSASSFNPFIYFKF
jgi:alginate O-acetyltransferase complex protein AlgI